MQQTGEYQIAAPRVEVWRALNDPDVLARCMDGCESMTRVSDDAFEASVRARIGPVSATFKADLTISNANPPESYTLTAQVKGGAAGFGKGSAHVTLTENGSETTLRYQVEGSVGGKLAQVGQRLIDGATRKMADDFFGCLRNELAPVTVGSVAEGVEAPAPVPMRRFERTGRLTVWLIAFAVLILAILLSF